MKHIQHKKQLTAIALIGAVGLAFALVLASDKCVECEQYAQECRLRDGEPVYRKTPNVYGCVDIKGQPVMADMEE